MYTIQSKRNLSLMKMMVCTKMNVLFWKLKNVKNTLKAAVRIGKEQLKTQRKL